jgi:hypothetical protein
VVFLEVADDRLDGGASFELALGARIYQAYHMEAADVFYNREDLWQFPRGVIRRYFLGLINRLVIFSAYGLGCAFSTRNSDDCSTLR